MSVFYLLHVNAQIKQLQFSFHSALNNCYSLILENLVTKDTVNNAQTSTLLLAVG